MDKIVFELGNIDEINYEIQNINDIDFELSQSPSVFSNNYEELINKPKINSRELIGDKNGNELDLVNASNFLTNREIEELLNSQI